MKKDLSLDDIKKVLGVLSIKYKFFVSEAHLQTEFIIEAAKLFTCKLFLERYMSFPNYKNFSYTDIFEISLELIFEQTIGKK